MCLPEPTKVNVNPRPRCSTLFFTPSTLVMTSLTLLSLLGIASQVAAQIGKSTAICADAEWTFFKGNSPCQLWANLQAVCDPSASVVALDTATNANAQYPNPSGSSATPCQCNIVAYNLMAACTWCQPSFHDNWVSEAQWKSDCSDYDSSGLPSQASPLSSETPPWAFTMQKGQSWLASDASRIISEVGPTHTATIENRQLAGTGVSTDTGLVSGTFPTAAPTFRGTGTGFSSITRPTTARFSTTRFPAATRTPFRGGSDDVSVGLARIIAILILVTLGCYVAFGLITLFVCFRRQRNRKALYGPTAQFYRNGGRMVQGDQSLLAPSQPWGQHAPAQDPFRTPSRTPSPPPVPGPDIMNYSQEPQGYNQHHYGAYVQQPATYPPPQRNVN